MPNDITNIITIVGVSQERLDEIRAAIKVDDMNNQNSIDFNKLIPMPPELNVESGSRSKEALELYQSYVKESAALAQLSQINSVPEDEYKAAVSDLHQRYNERAGGDETLFSFGKQLYENTEKYGAADWYEWSLKNWGSKWNSYGYDSPDPDVAANQIKFLTAWSGVQPILERLSEMFPDAQFCYQWADEDLSVNVGEQIWRDGDVVGEYLPTPQSAEAYEMAADIIGIDLAECGLIFSDEDETYHYVKDLDMVGSSEEDESENNESENLEWGEIT